jgi:ketosteroid isomerase-like protein
MAGDRSMRGLAEEFVAAWNGADIDHLGRLFHPEFRWHIAVTPYDQPQLRPLQSTLHAGMNLPWEKSIYDKTETLRIFGRIFSATDQFALELRSVIADQDRAALELVGSAVHPVNGRRYDNLYCYIFEMHDDQLVLLREYQDTLLLFDVWVAQ